jgi:hypothetical protein
MAVRGIERPTRAGQTQQASRGLGEAASQAEAVVERLDGIAADRGNADEMKAGEVDPARGGQDVVPVAAFVVATRTAGAAAGRDPFFSTASA